jgi:uncharacterized protein YkwD
MGFITKILIILSILSIVGCTIEPNISDYTKFESTLTISETKPIEIEILELINTHRESIGLNRLDYLPLIKSVAHKHNIEMIGVNMLSHNGFVKRAEYLMYKTNGTKVAENLAYGYTNANSIVIAWLKSPNHRINIEGDFTYFDISVDQNKDGKNYTTNIFLKK